MCVRVSERQSSLSLLATGNMYVCVCVCPVSVLCFRGMDVTVYLSPLLLLLCGVSGRDVFVVVFLL